MCIYSCCFDTTTQFCETCFFHTLVMFFVVQTGLAVGDVQEIRDNATVEQLAKRVSKDTYHTHVRH